MMVNGAPRPVAEAALAGAHIALGSTWLVAWSVQDATRSGVGWFSICDHGHAIDKHKVYALRVLIWLVYRRRVANRIGIEYNGLRLEPWRLRRNSRGFLLIEKAAPGF